ncbi:MAG TPA: Pr6Pr family membrane protein [candidate division Zixibacteria bacterium]|nr:Pr6Pr family membrane protein [candidate division Zixibacteria bacterium]
MGDRLLGAVRIGFGLLILAAIAFMISVLLGEGVFNPLNFFTFFTILSNLFAAAVLLEGGRRQLSGQAPIPDLWRGAAVVYMTVTYIVFAVLLRDAQEDLQTHVPWVDSVLHRVAPIVLMLDWVIEPPHAPITFRRALAWLGFPVVWTALTMVRGAIDGRYPYPFLDPDNGGYGIVAIYVVAILVLFLAISWVVASAGTALRERRRDA